MKNEEYPNDKETQEWMNAPLGNPNPPTPEQQVIFWSDKYDKKCDELHEVWKELKEAVRQVENSDKLYRQQCQQIANQMKIIDRLTQETFTLNKKIKNMEAIVYAVGDYASGRKDDRYGSRRRLLEAYQKYECAEGHQE